MDGFFSALIVGPGSVAPNDYVPHVVKLAGDIHRGPGALFDNAVQAEYVTSLLTRYWSTIALRLRHGAPHPPHLAIDDGDVPEGALWSSGFLRAVALRIKDWECRRGDEFVTTAIHAMRALTGRDDGVLARKLNRRERSQFVATLPLILETLHERWHGQGDPLARRPLPREHDFKIGRNERCPCGSGK